MKVVFFLSLLLHHQMMVVSTDEFRGCEHPALEWVTMTGGKGSQFYTRDAHILGNHLVVVGDLQPTLDVPGNYALIGPITPQDPSGELTKTLSKTITRTNIEPEGDVNAYAFGNDIGINVIDIRTGEPIEAMQLNNAIGTAEMQSVGAAQTINGEDIVAIGGRFTGQIHLDSTNACTPLTTPESGATRYAVDCSDGTRLTSALAPELDPLRMAAGEWRQYFIGQSSLLTSMTINRDATSDSGNWVLEYNWAKIPWTGTFGSEVETTTVDPRGDVFAGGRACFGEAVLPPDVNCVARVGKYDAANGNTQWEVTLSQFSNIYGIEYDDADGLLFFTGFHGPSNDVGDPVTCPDSGDGCQVVGAMDGSNGDILWLRSLNNEKNLGTFQNGEVKLAHVSDGPYIYAVLSVTSASESLDTGTPYSACRKADGSFIPDYEVVQDRFMREEDCTSQGHNFVPSSSEEAIRPQTVPTGVACTVNGFNTQGCTMKFHKFTGRPIWATSKVQPRAMEASRDGPLISGSFRPTRGSFDGIQMRDLGKNEVFQALLDKDTGKGVYVQHFYDYDTHFHGNGAATDDEGNYYIATRSNPTRILDGDQLQLSLPVENVIMSKLVVLKLDTKPGGVTRSPTCLTCENGVRTVRTGYCFEGEVCFLNGETGKDKLGEGALICDAEANQTALLDFRGDDPDECKICGKDAVMTKPEGLFDASVFGAGMLECSLLEQFGLSDNLNLNALGLDCSAVPNLVTEACGCEPITDAPTEMPTVASATGQTATAVPAESSGSEEGLSTGAIVGIAVAGALGLFLLVGLLVKKKLVIFVHLKRKSGAEDSIVEGVGADAADVHETDSSLPASIHSSIA